MTLTTRLAAIKADGDTFARATRDNIGGSRMAALRAFLFTYANGSCVVCGEACTMARGERNSACVGHLIPASAVGASSDRCGILPGNVALMCVACNDLAGSHDFSTTLGALDVAGIPTEWPTLKPVTGGRASAHDATARASRAARGLNF